MLISKVKALVILGVRELIIDLEFARIRILPNTPNYVMLGVCFNFLEPVSLHVKCEDNNLTELQRYSEA